MSVERSLHVLVYCNLQGTLASVHTYTSHNFYHAVTWRVGRLAPVDDGELQLQAVAGELQLPALRANKAVLKIRTIEY